MVFSALIALVALPLTALASPSRLPIPNLDASSVHPLLNFEGCPVSNDTLTLPAGSSIAVPSGQTPIAVTMGVGVQNYTCSNGTFTSVYSSLNITMFLFSYRTAGAVATLFDISCLVGTPEFANVQNDFFALPASTQQQIEGCASRTRLLYAHHYFVTNPLTGTGISPKFALAANGGADFSILNKTGTINSPAGATNVAWLQLTSIQGTLAKTVFRVDTVGGQPPTTCTGTSPTSIPYAAKYCPSRSSCHGCLSLTIL